MFGDFIGQTSTVVGNGSDLTLGDPVGSGVTWRSRFADGEVVFYLDTMRDAQKRELGWGVLTHGTPDKIERNVIFSTQADARVTWAVDDLHTAYSVPVAVVMNYMLKGGLGDVLPGWAPNGSSRWSYDDDSLSTLWKHRLKTAAGEIELGRHDVAKGAYFPSPRRPWVATGTSGKTVDADDIGGVFTFDNAAAARTMTLPPHGDAGIGHGFKVGGLGLTAGGQYGIVLTPAAADGIEGGADAATKTIPGGVRFDVVWDQASDTWRVEYLNTQAGWETGDYRISSRATTSLSGWVKVDDGTIGSAASSATTRANADAWPLYEHLYTSFSDAICPVSGGRGANAAADFAANKTITLSAMLGRALVVAGTGSGLTSRALGGKTGTETHTHTGTTGSNSGGVSTDSGGQSTAPSPHTHTFTTDAGSSMQPSTFVTVFMKL